MITKTKKIASPIRWAGGKSKAISQIKEMFPKEKFPLYVEPFVGGGSVFLLAKEEKIADKYWINDLYYPLYCFLLSSKNYRKNLVIEFLKKIHNMEMPGKKAKKLFLKFKKCSPKTQTGEAIKFFFINRCSFSGTSGSGGFSEESFFKRFTESSIDRIESFSDSLANAEITNEDAIDIIKKIPEGSFIYLDPPYISASKLYGSRGSLSKLDHLGLAKAIKENSHRFKFLMTYDNAIFNNKELRDIYIKFNTKNWSLQYSMDSFSRKNSKIGSEVFIWNYDI